jgi:hypothetical protein
MLTLGLLLASLLSIVQAAVRSSVAEARCVSAGHGTRSTLLDIVLEEPLAGSCNNNQYYQGRFILARGDGIAYVFIQNNGVWRRYDGGTDNLWHEYAYIDSNSNSWMTLCYTKFSPTVETYCGWGSNLLHYRGSITAANTADFNNSLYHGVNAGF